MIKAYTAALAAALTLAGGPTRGQGGLADLDMIAMMHGRCSRLLVAGRNQSNVCASMVINETFKSGRVGFTFLVGQAAEVIFSGMGPRQRKLTANKVFQPLDAVIFTINGPAPRPMRMPAIGGCMYENPFAGRAGVACLAHTVRGDYAGAFMSDGKEPVIKQF